MDRLADFLYEGRHLTQDDVNFYEHELYECNPMDQGVGYDEAHQAALDEYGVDRMSLYSREVVSKYREWFDKPMREFYGVWMGVPEDPGE